MSGGYAWVLQWSTRGLGGYNESNQRYLAEAPYVFQQQPEMSIPVSQPLLPEPEPARCDQNILEMKDRPLNLTVQNSPLSPSPEA